MNRNLDKELAELESALEIFLRASNPLLSIDSICRALEAENHSKEQVIEKMHRYFGVHDSISCLQLADFIRKKIALLMVLKESA